MMFDWDDRPLTLVDRIAKRIPLAALLFVWGAALFLIGMAMIRGGI